MRRFHQAPELSRGDQGNILGTAATNHDRLPRGRDLVTQGRKVGTGVSVGGFGTHGDPPLRTGTLYTLRLAMSNGWLSRVEPVNRSFQPGQPIASWSASSVIPEWIRTFPMMSKIITSIMLQLSPGRLLPDPAGGRRRLVPSPEQGSATRHKYLWLYLFGMLRRWLWSRSRHAEELAAYHIEHYASPLRALCGLLWSDRNLREL
jgi:hypothetical protein